MNNKKFGKFGYLVRSRKFWAAIVGVLFVYLNAFAPDFPIGQEQLTNVIYLLVAYILSVAIEDAGHGVGGGRPG